MDNFFVAGQGCGSNKHGFLTGLVNRGLQSLKTSYRVQQLPNNMADMTTTEQRINYFHLLDSVIANNIAGDVVELGCFTGQCALLFQRVIRMHHSSKALHLYDSFEVKLTVKGNVEDVLISNFKGAGLPLPGIHKGYFQDTLSSQLPARIAFAHIDCGYGGDPSLHKATVLHCLESVYPRMSAGAVCVLMDYQDTASDAARYDVNPGVKLACDEFLASKVETVTSLYGNQYSHGFFRKAGRP